MNLLLVLIIEKKKQGYKNMLLINNRYLIDVIYHYY